MKEKLLIIMRHADRDGTNPSLDNGLNENGKKQAQDLANYFKERFQAESIQFLSGPKIRCQETLQPTVDSFGGSMEINNMLDERAKGSEDEMAFRKRIEDFFTWWQHDENAPDIILASSHGDWVPLALEILNAADQKVSKAGWIEIIRGETFPRFKTSTERIGA